MSRRRSAAATPVTIQRKAHHIASPVQALVLPKKEAAAFLKAHASADPESLETVPEACAAMLCTAKAGLQQRQARPIMSMDTAQLSAAGKLARRLVEVEVRLLRSWQAAAAEALQGEPELLWAGTEVGACGLVCARSELHQLQGGCGAADPAECSSPTWESASQQPSGACILHQQATCHC